MSNILTNSGISIEMIRYFDYQGKKYLIFTDNGNPDQQGHITIRVSEVDETNGMAATEVEYNFAKDIIKTIVNSNKNNTPLIVKDLNYQNLNGINIISSQAFKLVQNYVEILKQNQPIFDEPDAHKVENINSGISDLNDYGQENISGVDLNVINQIPVSNVEDFNNSLSTENNDLNNFEQKEIQTPTSNETVDYQKLYLEQVELVKNLSSEIELYKNKLETLKNIINN